MGISMIIYSVFTFVAMNYAYHMTLISTNKVMTTLDMKERQNIQTLKSSFYLVAHTLGEDKTWFDCSESERECLNKDEDDYYPLYLSEMSSSSSFSLNNSDISVFAKRNALNENYIVKFKIDNKITTREYIKNIDGSISFSLSNTNELSGQYIPSI